MMDRNIHDLYRVETADGFAGALLVNFMTGEVMGSSPNLRYYVGAPIGYVYADARHLEWRLRLVPHEVYEDVYKSTERLLHE